MASANSKFDNLSETDIDSLIDDAIPKNTKKATAWGISVLKGKVANFNFFIHTIVELCFCVLSTALPALNKIIIVSIFFFCLSFRLVIQKITK